MMLGRVPLSVSMRLPTVSSLLCLKFHDHLHAIAERELKHMHATNLILEKRRDLCQAVTVSDQ